MVGRPVFLKYDGANPTGSFKDRGMTVAVSKALEAGAKAVACASTGNTSASAAAYAARAGLACVVVLPAGNVALGKLAQAIRHGARVVCVEGAFDAALEVVRAFTAGRRCGAGELGEPRPHRRPADRRLGDRGGPGRGPGGAGPAGGQRRQHHRLLDGLPGGRARRPGCGASRPPGAAPIVHGAPVAHPETVATAIRIGNPASWKGAVAARDESGGIIEAVTDDQILAAYRLIAEEEGVFAEPASAASVAGVLAFRDRLPDGPGGVHPHRPRPQGPAGGAAEIMPDLPVIAPQAEALREWLGW